jgi:hypothetical protein
MRIEMSIEDGDLVVRLINDDDQGDWVESVSAIPVMDIVRAAVKYSSENYAQAAKSE